MPVPELFARIVVGDRAVPVVGSEQQTTEPDGKELGSLPSCSSWLISTWYRAAPGIGSQLSCGSRHWRVVAQAFGVAGSGSRSTTLSCVDASFVGHCQVNDHTAERLPGCFCASS